MKSVHITWDGAFVGSYHVSWLLKLENSDFNPVIASISIMGFFCFLFFGFFFFFFFFFSLVVVKQEIVFNQKKKKLKEEVIFGHHGLGYLWLFGYMGNPLICSFEILAVFNLVKTFNVFEDYLRNRRSRKHNVTTTN